MTAPPVLKFLDPPLIGEKLTPYEEILPWDSGNGCLESDQGTEKGGGDQEKEVNLGGSEQSLIMILIRAEEYARVQARIQNF